MVYFPYFEGKLSLADLFAAHNEHRIFFTRIYGLGLLLLNGQWDGQLQMVINAIIHCATLAGLGWLMSRWLEKRYWILLWLPLILALALPLGWENSLAGFQSQFYFLLVFSLLTLWLLGLHKPNSARWWCGAVAAVMSLFTLASGFLAAAAVFALVLFRVCKSDRRKAGNRREPRRWPSVPRSQWLGCLLESGCQSPSCPAGTLRLRIPDRSRQQPGLAVDRGSAICGFQPASACGSRLVLSQRERREPPRRGDDSGDRDLGDTARGRRRLRARC